MTVKRWGAMKFNSEGWDTPVNEIGVFEHDRGEYVKFTDYDTREGDLLAENERLRDALKLIAEQTICPDLFPLETDEDRLAYKTAFVIATVALERSSPDETGAEPTS